MLKLATAGIGLAMALTLLLAMTSATAWPALKRFALPVTYVTGTPLSLLLSWQKPVRRNDSGIANEMSDKLVDYKVRMQKHNTDIIERLEANGIGPQSNPQIFALCKEAAEEIRQLRTKVKVLTDDLEAEIKSNYG